jgi:uncharacterized protein involved in exopolysaccharide biosynthesis
MVLFRQRKAFRWAAGAVLVATIVYAFVGPKYESNMKVLVRHGRADAPVSANESAPLDVTRLQVTEEELNSEVELLRDDEVLKGAVEESGVGTGGWLDSWHWGESRPQKVERAARRLAGKLKVEPVKKTNLIAVRYAADDPQVAAKVLRAVAEQYLEKHTAVHRPSGELGFFEQQTSESRRQLEDSESALLRFAGNRGVVAAALQRDLALQKLSEMDAGDRQTQVQLAETEQRISGLREQLSRLPQRSTTQIRTSDNPELMKSLKANLLDLQLKRIQLLTKFEPSHKLVQEVDRQIGRTQSAIAAEALTPLRDETTDKDARYEWADAELIKAQVQRKDLEARESATNWQKVAYAKTALELGKDAVVQDDLISRERAAEENYLLYVKKREEARMDDALDARGIVNVAIAEEPVAPALPVWSTSMILAVGLIASGSAGVGAAFAADYLTPSFRDPDDVIAYLGAPVLACLPRESSGELCE